MLIDVALRGFSSTSTSSPLPNPMFVIRGKRSEMLLLSRSSLSRLVKPDSADTFEMLLLERYRYLRLVNADNGVMSEILLLEIESCHILVKFARGDISEIELADNHSVPRLVNAGSEDKSVIELLQRFRYVRLIKFDNGAMFEMLLRERSRRFSRVANSSPVKSLMFEFGTSRRVKVDISALVIAAPLALPRLSEMTVRRFASGMFTGVGSLLTGVGSKEMSTPLLCRAGMCVLIDVALSGLFRTSTRSPAPKPIFATKGEKSVIEFLERSKYVRLVKPDSGVMSEMLLLERRSHIRLVNRDSGAMSDMLLL